ncbi:nucleotide exchange factor Sil1 [Eurosta solidaginis]|uniref:nucleotide exchange factor Sil1 n=1 Tax=Eurosta solidaginis TaxID=178769 RepID=UPI003530EBBB
MNLIPSLTLLLLAEFAIAVGKIDNKTFEATNTWQEIKEGQQIPAGLHVRINLRTGKKEAKLLDHNEKEKNENNALSEVADDVNEETKHKVTDKHKLKFSSSLSEAIKSLPKDSLGLTYSPEKLRQIKRDFKTYDELKKSFKDFQKNFQTDAELITQLIYQYKNLTKDEQELSISLKTKITTQLRILEDLDYLVHQIDNALLFIDKGGLEDIILPLVVNETNINLRVKGIRVLGALTLNNPKAQIKAFEKNVGAYLSQILSSSTNTDELSATLYAIGSILRKFPMASQRILSTSGVQALVAVLSKQCDLKVKAKAVTLISDIIVEKKLVLSKNEDADSQLAAAQYAELNLPEWLQANGFCDAVDSVISTNLHELLHQPDLMEYFVVGLENSAVICRPIWSKSAQLRHTLLTIKNRYIYEKEEYRKELAEQIEKLVGVLYNSEAHDEL